MTKIHYQLYQEESKKLHKPCTAKSINTNRHKIREEVRCKPQLSLERISHDVERFHEKLREKRYEYA